MGTEVALGSCCRSFVTSGLDEANRAALKSVAEVDEAGVATVKALQVLFEDYKAEVEPAPHMFHVLESPIPLNEGIYLKSQY